MPNVNKDVVAFAEDDGRWVLMNVFTRSCLGVSPEALELLSLSATLSDEALWKHFKGRHFRTWEIEWFSHYAGLLENPTRFLRDVTQWPSEELLGAQELYSRMIKHHLIIEDEDQYLELFAPDPAFEEKNPRAYKFASEFPILQKFEMKLIP